MSELAGLQALAHPSVVRVRDVGRLEDGRIFLITERVAGSSIDSVASISDEGAAARGARAHGARSGGALAHLHGRGIVHGDVCPGRTMFRLGRRDRGVRRS
jgi:serine/threonine protein kinase